ncbi:hypothetical protein EJB05_36029, partial [Eragrostis curvula]
MEEGSSSGGATAGIGPDDAEAEADVMARFSPDVSAGCGGRHSTLLDEYERLAFEAQLNRAIVLRRCYSEPSPVRFAHDQPPPAGGAPAPAALCGEAEAPRHERSAAGAGRFWRLHEPVARWLRALEPVLRWLRSAWERRRKTEQASAAVPPRVQLVDYLR